MPSVEGPDAPPSTPTNTKPAFVQLSQRVAARRSARSARDDCPVAPGFGTRRDLQRLARELSDACERNTNHNRPTPQWTVEAVQCLMERRGRGLRGANAEEPPPPAAVSSAWDDFMKEAGMEPDAAPAATAVTGKRGRAEEAAATTTTSTTNAAREYNLSPFLGKRSRRDGGGVLLQTGTLDCAVVGRKMAELHWDAPYTLSVPTRILSPSIKIDTVVAAGHACHCLAISVDGKLYGWGRNEQSQLGSGLPKNVYTPTQIPLGGGSEPRVTQAAVGKGHSLVLLASGQVMACGANKSGQCGINSMSTEVVSSFSLGHFANMETPRAIVQVAAGEDFSVVLCDEGKMYSTGSSEFGQLGNGATGEYFVTANKLAFANCAAFTLRNSFCHVLNEKIYSSADTNTKVVPLVEDIRLQQIACGKHHTIALEADVADTASNTQPRVFTWGCGNYGVLGHGVQADEYFPRLVGALTNLYFTAGAGRATVAAGAHCSLLQTAQGQVYYWGKHRMVGEATMRPALVDALAHNDHVVTHCAAGGQTVVCCTAHGQSVGWGQGPHGELGLGLDRKSSSKPTFIPGLEGCHVLSLGCGYGTTMFVVRDSEAADRERIEKIPVLDPTATDALVRAAEVAEAAAKTVGAAAGKKGKSKS